VAGRVVNDLAVLSSFPRFDRELWAYTNRKAGPVAEF